MPTYEFKCPEGHLFEKFFPAISEQRRAKCPKCGKQAQRQISAGAGLVFKGSGFYITDYKRAGDKAWSSEGDAKPADASKSDKADASKSDKADASKSDKADASKSDKADASKPDKKKKDSSSRDK